MPGFLGPPTQIGGEVGRGAGQPMPPTAVGGQTPAAPPRPGPGAWVDAGYGTGPLIGGFQRARMQDGHQLADDGGMAPPPQPTQSNAQQAGASTPAFGTPWPSSAQGRTRLLGPPTPAPGNPYGGVPMPRTYLA